MAPKAGLPNIKRLVYFEKLFDPIAEKTLVARPEIDLVRLRYKAPEAETWPEIARAHGYQIQPRGELSEPWFGNAALLQRCPSLLAICSSGAGYDMVDVDACTAAGVIVCNQSGFNKEAVAEHALGFILALSKKISLADRALRRENVTDRWKFMGNDIRGKTVGLVGIGQIGTRTAELCRLLFGMTVLAYDPYLTKEQIADRGGTKVELDELMRRSDFVSVHCPRNAETMGMLGSAQFALMKPYRLLHQHRAGRHPSGGRSGAGAQGAPDRRRRPRRLPAGTAAIRPPAPRLRHGPGDAAHGGHDRGILVRPGSRHRGAVDRYLRRRGAAAPGQSRGLAALRRAVRADSRRETAAASLTLLQARSTRPFVSGSSRAATTTSEKPAIAKMLIA